MPTITAHELALRLSALGNTPVTTDDLAEFASAAGLTIHPAKELNASHIEALLREAPQLRHISTADVLAARPDPAASSAEDSQSRPAIPPVVFSNPGSVDNPQPPATPARRRSGGGDQHRRNEGNRRPR